MPPRVTLLSLNVEGAYHLDLVLPFLREELPDVATLQEVNEQDVGLFSNALGGASCFFVPMGRHLRDGIAPVLGVGIFSRLSVKKQEARYYEGDSGSIPDSDRAKPETYNSINRVLAVCDVEKEGVVFRIATTHFSWSPQGQPTDLQREKLRMLFGILNTLDDFILTGDFNAPRGGEIFDALAARYTDNVPARYVTSIDPTFHRAGALPYMVDGLFSTPGYMVSDVELIPGLSDHCALRATISKARF